MNKQVKDIVKELHRQARVVKSKNISTLDTTDNGVVNPDNVFDEKVKLFQESVFYLIEELVDAKKSYPNNGFMNIAFETDFITLPSSVYYKLLNFLENELEDE